MAKGFKQFIRNADQFGSPVQMTYKGDTEYKTFTGGFFSLIINIIVLQYSIGKLGSMINYEN